MLGILFRQMKRLVVDNDLETFPIGKSFRGYNGKRFGSDIRAALNVALLAIPQGMAYASLAGLPVYYGITCSIIASIIAPILSGSSYTVLGPTNATAFLVFVTMGAYSIALMPLLVLLVGLILITGAFLRIADLVQYVSRSVVVGYITGAAILIIANQMKHVLGVDLDPKESTTFVEVILGLSKAGSEVSWPPLVIGGLTATLYFTLRRLIKRLAFPATLVLVTLIAVVLKGHVTDFESIKDFSGDTFSLAQILPAMPELSGAELFNTISLLFGTALGVSFLAALETSVMSKTLAGQTGEPSNLNQDMLSVGVANVCGSFLSGMPASGSLTRSALNFASGAITRLSSVYSGLICLLGAVLLGNLVAYIPKACLAALVICVAVTLINPRSIRICMNATGSDAAVLTTTLIAALVARLDIAIFLGTAVSIALYLKKASKPHLTEYEFNQEGQLAEAEKREQRNAISIVHVEGELFFGAAELFRTQIQHVCLDPNIKVIILRLKNARHLDATSVMALEELIRFMRERERHLIISGASPEVHEVLKNSGLLEVLDDDPEIYRTEEKDRNLFLNNPFNPNLSTRDALIRAQQVIGGEDEPDIRIFFDPSKDKK
jgi:sulfate permease, SulP family